MPVYHATLDDLNKTAIEKFFKQRKSSKQLPKDYKDALLAYQLITREHTQEYPTVAGVHLFGKEPDRFIPEAMTICSRFKGIEGREAQATRDCYGTLFDQFHEAYEFVVSKLNRSFIIDAPRRTEQLEIPETAIRQAILNALLHRNYTIKCPTKIVIYNNRVEIFSPGSFPGPIKSSNIKEGYTFVKNSTLMKVFREMGYVEKLGTGIPAILKSFEEQGLPEPEIRETDDFVKYVLRRPSHEHTPDTDEEARILRLFESANELQISEIAIITSITRATVGRKLNLLVEKSILKKVGAGRSTRYIRIK